MSLQPNNLTQLQSERLRATANMFAAVAAHGTIIGTAREIALTEFFRSIIPKRYEVLSGAIAAEEEGKLAKASNQLDVLIVDTFEYPTLLRTGDLAVALAPSVHVVVEAKSDLDRGKKFEEAMTQIGQAKDCAETSTLTALYCFTYPANSSTLRGWIEDILGKRKQLIHEANAETDSATKQGKLESASYYSATNLPDLILSDKGAIAILESSVAEDNKPIQMQYQFYSTIKGSPTIVALASRVLTHISRVRSPNGDGKSFKILIDHFEGEYQKSTADDEKPLDVTDEQQPDSVTE